MRRAFTLIELLVVIAIIAILAAILFPVFARAKESAQKTSAVSNAKQVATSIVLYMVDSDDSLPSMYSISSTGRVLWTRSVETPAGWLTPSLKESDAQAWANSTEPYRKNWELLNTSGPTPTDIGAPTANRSLPTTTLTTNGLLHHLSASEIASPSRLTLVWHGNMKESIKGFSFANPSLNCPIATAPAGQLIPPCRFTPAAGSQPGGAYGPIGDELFPPYSSSKHTMWVIGRGVVMVAVDTSAKFVPMNPSGVVTPTGQRVTSYSDPTLRYGQNAQPLTYHRCRPANSTISYLSFFRPDSEFNYDFGTATTTRCGP